MTSDQSKGGCFKDFSTKQSEIPWEASVSVVCFGITRWFLVWACFDLTVLGLEREYVLVFWGQIPHQKKCGSPRSIEVWHERDIFLFDVLVRGVAFL